MNRNCKTLALMVAASMTALATLGASDVHAQSASRPTRLIVPFAPGGLIDATARAIAPRFAELAGRSIIVENRPGAGGTLGMTEVVRAAPDGNTLLFSIETLAATPALYPKLGIDPQRDLAPITQLVSVPITYVAQPSLGVNSLAELVALAKREPNRLTSASGGNGTVAHLALEMFKHAAAIDIVHVPYRGANPAFTDFLGGQVAMITVSTALIAPHARAGRAKVLAVAAAKRAANLPDVPTTAEAGFPHLEATVWMGLFAPAGTPAATIDALHDAAVRALNEPANVKRWNDQGLEIIGSTPAAFRRFLASETTRAARVIAAARITAD